MIELGWVNKLGNYYQFIAYRYMAKISVIIPVKETGGYLKECLESVVNQTLLDIEIIIVGDSVSSSDAVIIDHYIEQDPRCVFINNKDKIGSGFCRNLGIGRASGKYIAFMDGDDFYPDNDVLNNLFYLAEREKVNICGGRLFVYDNVTKQYEVSKSGLSEEISGMINYKNYQRDGGFYRFIYSRNFLLENNIFFPNYLRFQDAVFFVTAMINAGHFYSTNLVTYIYRKNHKSICWDRKKLSDHFHAVFYISNMANKEGLKKLQYLMAKNLLETCHFRLSRTNSTLSLYLYITYGLLFYINWKNIFNENKINKVKVVPFKILYFLVKSIFR